MSIEHVSLKKYAKAYYWSTKFLPKAARDDVFKLYSFIQCIDDISDSKNPQIKQIVFVERRWRAIKKQLAADKVPPKTDESEIEYALANIAYIVHRYRCDASWVDAFLQSKRWDIENHQYKSFKDIERYMYGNGEVIGLFVARILKLPEESMRAVRMQSRAIQIVDFLRNIPLDAARGRCYFASNEIKMHGLKALNLQEANAKPNMFTDFMQSQLLRYATWQTEANKGLYYFPKKIRVPMQTTIDSYNWTAQQIKNDPLIIFKKQVKHKKRRIIYRAVKHTVKRPV